MTFAHLRTLEGTLIGTVGSTAQCDNNLTCEKTRVQYSVYRSDFCCALKKSILRQISQWVPPALPADQQHGLLLQKNTVNIYMYVKIFAITDMKFFVKLDDFKRFVGRKRLFVLYSY